MENSKNIVIFMQLGSPRSPKTSDVKEYLELFLSNKRVVENQGPFWKIVLHLFILPFRSKKSAIRYQKIWDGNMFTLKRNSEYFFKKVKKRLSEFGIESYLGFSFDQKRLHELFNKIESENSANNKWLIVPLFPQSCEASNGLLFDSFYDVFKEKRVIPNMEYLSSYHDHPLYIESSIKHIEANLVSIGNIDKLILSFHNMPIDRLEKNKDPYLEQCKGSFELIKSGIKAINSEKILISFQSGFGRAKKIEPLTEKLLLKIIKKGHKNIAIFCPGFLMDNLETTVEIGLELKELAASKGATLHYIPCLNDQDFWCDNFSSMIKSILKRD